MGVQSLLSDPDFQKLPPQQQKQALAGIDPEFGNLNDEQFAKVKAGLGGRPGNYYTANDGSKQYLPTKEELGPVQGGPVVPGGLSTLIPMAAGYGVQSGADAMGAPPWLSSGAGILTSVLTGGAGSSPKVQAFAKGAVNGAKSELPTSGYAILHGRSGPGGLLGWLAGHAVGHPVEGAILGTAAGAAPAAIRGGMAAAENAPWLPQAPVVRPPPGWQDAGTTSTPNAAPPPVEPIPATATPSGRKPGGIQNQTPMEAPTKVAAPPSENSELDALAREGIFGKKYKSFAEAPSEAQTVIKAIAGKTAPVTPPPASAPSFKPDIESKVIAPDVQSGPVQPGKFEATLKGHQSAKAQKIQNIHDYLTTAKHDYTPEKLVQMDQASPGKLSPAKQTFLKDAYDWAQSQGRPVPKNGYTSLNLQETRPGYEGQGTLQDVLDLMQGKEINPMHMPIKDPFGWGK